MNFEFSEDQKQLRDQARRYLTEHSPPKAVRVRMACYNASG